MPADTLIHSIGCVWGVQKTIYVSGGPSHGQATVRRGRMSCTSDLFTTMIQHGKPVGLCIALGGEKTARRNFSLPEPQTDNVRSKLDGDGA